MDMQVAEIAQGVARVVLKGRLDIQGAAKIDLEFSAVAGSRRGVVVDMSEGRQPGVAEPDAGCGTGAGGDGDHRFAADHAR